MAGGQVKGPSLAELAAEHLGQRKKDDFNLCFDLNLDAVDTFTSPSFDVVCDGVNSADSLQAPLVDTGPIKTVNATSVSSLLGGLVIADINGDYQYEFNESCTSESSSATDESIYNNHLINIDNPVTRGEPSQFSITLSSHQILSRKPQPRTFNILDMICSHRDRNLQLPGGSYFYEFSEPSPAEVKCKLHGVAGAAPVSGPAQRMRRSNKDEQLVQLRRYVRGMCEGMTRKRERTRIYVSFPAEHGRRKFGFDSQQYWNDWEKMNELEEQ